MTNATVARGASSVAIEAVWSLGTVNPITTVTALPINGITIPKTGATPAPAAGWPVNAGGTGYSAALTSWTAASGGGTTFGAEYEAVARVTLTLEPDYIWGFTSGNNVSRDNFIKGFLPSDGAKSIASSSTSNTGDLVLNITYLKTASSSATKTIVWQLEPSATNQTATKIDLTLKASAISNDAASTLTYTWYKAAGPSVAVSPAQDTLKGNGKEYAVPNTLNEGTHYYYVIVTGSAQEAAKTSAVTSFWVSKRDISPTEISVGGTNVVYNGREQGVDPAEYDGVAGDQYTWTYTYKRLNADGTDDATEAVKTTASTTNNPEKVVNAGTYRVTVNVSSPKEKGEKTGIIFTVEPKELSDDMINITELSGKAREYDGKQKTPTVKVVDSEITGSKGNLQIATRAPGVVSGEYSTFGDFFGRAGTSSTGTPDYTASTREKTIYKNAVNAGENEAYVEIWGQGNYKGSARAYFSIDKKVITVNTTAWNITARDYDGEDTLSKKQIDDMTKGTPLFNGLVETSPTHTLTTGDASPTNGKITVTGRFDGVDSSKTRVANIEVELGDDEVASNYRFEGGNTATFARTGVWIKARDIKPEDFVYEDFTKKTYYYTGAEQGIGEISFKFPQPDNVEVSVLYTINGKDTSDLPVAVGSYTVKALVTGVSGRLTKNYILKTDKKEVLGQFVISNPLKPSSVSITAAPGLTVRANRSIVLTAKATVPKELDTTAITYNWYKEGAGSGSSRVDTLVAENAGKTYEPPTDVVNKTGVKYYVWAVYAPAADIQVPDSTKSSSVTVKIDDPAISIATAQVTVGGTYTYNGNAFEPKASDITVMFGTTKLVNNTNYKILPAEFNVDAGFALVKVYGINQYEDTAVGTFEIKKKVLTKADLAPVLSATYSGQPLPLVVNAAGKLTNLGDVSVTYDGSAEVPVNAGTYAVAAKVTETISSNFKVEPADTVFALGSYQILKKQATRADLDYNVNLLAPDSILVSKAPADGIGPVTLKAGDDYGTLTVLYAGKETVPTAKGRYAVTVRISGGNNFTAALISLGDYKLVDVIVGVKAADRIVPTAPVVTEAAVAPVKVAAASFTAGPSPVSKNGVIKFFSRTAVKTGSLYIFDASGNVVAKVAAKSATGEVASWNLKDRNGAAVAEGTYVVKGALVGKDGTREKVSFVFSVVQ